MQRTWAAGGDAPNSNQPHGSPEERHTPLQQPQSPLECGLPSFKRTWLFYSWVCDCRGCAGANRCRRCSPSDRSLVACCEGGAAEGMGGARRRAVRGLVWLRDRRARPESSRRGDEEDASAWGPAVGHNHERRHPSRSAPMGPPKPIACGPGSASTARGGCRPRR